MMCFKFIFSAGKYGWSETWYHSDILTLKYMTDFAIRFFCPVRQKGLGVYAKIDAVRGTIVEQPGVSRLQAFQPEYPQTFTPGVDTRDCPWAGYLLHVRDVDFNYRRNWVPRGLPDAWFQRDFRGEETLPGPAIDWLKEFSAMMVKDLWRFRAWEKVLLTAMKPVQAAVVEAPSRYLRLTVLGHGMTGLGTVKIIKAKGTGVNYLNGSRPAQVIDGDTLRVLTRVPVGAAFAYTGDGLFSKREYFYPVFGAATWQRYVKRDTGGPWDVTRGRRRARKPR